MCSGGAKAKSLGFSNGCSFSWSKTSMARERTWHSQQICNLITRSALDFTEEPKSSEGLLSQHCSRNFSLWESSEDLFRERRVLTPQLPCFTQNKLNPRNSCARSVALLCNLSSAAVTGRTRLLGGVICALNSGLQATAEEQHLLAKTNRRQAPESFLPAPARRQEGRHPGSPGHTLPRFPRAPAAKRSGRGPCLQCFHSSS